MDQCNRQNQHLCVKFCDSKGVFTNSHNDMIFTRGIQWKENFGSGMFTLKLDFMDCRVSLAQMVMDLRTHLERP